MTLAICDEIKLKTDYLNHPTISTIYFGGGTPSFLPNDNLVDIVNSIKNNYTLAKDFEFTIECNPDDLNTEKLELYKSIGVNRLSVGIQSFEDAQLKFMNRAHNALEAVESIKVAQEKGFDNITIDLIYGLPNTTDDYWIKQIDKALKLNVNHISAYCLTIEPKTVFGNWSKKGKLPIVADDKSNKEFKKLIDILKQNDFEQYEISNFAKAGSISKHNSAYWLGEHYIGIGPSAHSYNGNTRQWNVANNYKYIQAINNNSDYFEVEALSVINQFNEHILTRLRTKWGVDLNTLNTISPQHFKSIQKTLNNFINNGDLIKNNEIVTLSEKGKYLADYITAELFG